MHRPKIANVGKSRPQAANCPFEFDHRSNLAAFLETAAQFSSEARQLLVDVLEEMGVDKLGERYRIELRIDPRLEQLSKALREEPALRQFAVRVQARVADRVTTRALSDSRDLLQGECVGLQDVAFLGAAYQASPSARAAILRAFDEIGAGKVGAAHRIEFRLDARLEQLAAQLREHPGLERLEREVALSIARHT
jgi:hypothetical protein